MKADMPPFIGIEGHDLLLVVEKTAKLVTRTNPALTVIQAARVFPPQKIMNGVIHRPTRKLPNLEFSLSNVPTDRDVVELIALIPRPFGTEMSELGQTTCCAIAFHFYAPFIEIRRWNAILDVPNLRICSIYE